MTCTSQRRTQSDNCSPRSARFTIAEERKGRGLSQSGKDYPANRILVLAPTGATHSPRGRIRTESVAAACSKQRICFCRFSSNRRQWSPAKTHVTLATIRSWQASTKHGKLSAVSRGSVCNGFYLEIEGYSGIRFRHAEEWRKHELDSRCSRGIVPVGATDRVLRVSSLLHPSRRLRRPKSESDDE